MRFMTTLLKAFVLANTTGMNVGQNQRNYFRIQKKASSSKHNKKHNKKTTNQTRILECIREIYETLSKKSKQQTMAESKSFLSHLIIPKLFEIKSKLFKKVLTEKDLYNSLKSMQRNKSPNNNG